MMFLGLQEIELQNPIDFIRLGELLPCTNLCPFVSFIKWKF